MAGDYTRFTFDSLRDYAGVLMQQGRVQLDADFNELVEMLDRRLRAETTDIIGRCTVPKETPDAFKIGLQGGIMTIGRGRMYVDGILAENHGRPPLEFDRILGESRGTQDFTYEDQPYLPNPDPLPEAGKHLVYLDVWRREVTAIEDPDLVEKAVGVDTATRLQTIWQVKIHSNSDIGPNATCETPDDQIPGWLDVINPSAGRLSTDALGQPASNDPCIIAPNGGFRGTENRLYRVEVHDGGALGAATFKWSRDNSSVATTVTAIDTNRTQLAVVRTGRDSVLRFNPGDWVEVTDDNRELAGLPGEMRKVQVVDDLDRTITLTTALPAGMFPTNPDDSTDKDRHTRVRRWDQRGQVRDASGNEVSDVDAENGVIPIPAVTLILEDGVQVTFSTTSAGGEYKVGDYWVFAARTADASVERLQQAPPRGIHHHYCRLAFVTFPESAIDCRHLWPPDFAGEGCDCTVCVTAESHNSGTLTIQRAIDQVRDTGGKVCLAPGDYNLDATIEISGTSVHLVGHGFKTRLNYIGEAPAILIRNGINITIENFALSTLLRPGNERTGLFSSIEVRDCLWVTVQNCFITNISLRGANDLSILVAIRLAGFLLQAIIRENVLAAEAGIVCFGVQRTGKLPDTQPVFTDNVYIEDNMFSCSRFGFISVGFCAHLFETRIRGNVLFGCREGGITILGLIPATPASHVYVDGNSVFVAGSGITIGTDRTRVKDNDLLSGGSEGQNDGIVITAGLDQTPGIDHCQIIGNRIRAFAGNGISIKTKINSAMIKQNIIDGLGGGGIVMQDGSSADIITVENNHILNVSTRNAENISAVGIRLIQAKQADVTNNKIVGVGKAASINRSREGILVILPTSARIVGNEVLDIGTDQFIGIGAGIQVVGPVHHLEVINNEVRRSKDKLVGSPDSNWFALIITGFQRAATPTAVDTVADGLQINRGFFVSTEANSFVGVFGNQLVNLPAIDSGNVAVRGNLFEGHRAAGFLVFCNVVGATGVVTSGVTVFSDNRCLLNNDKTGDGFAVVLLASGAMIVSTNYVQAPARIQGLALFLFGGPTGVAGAFTVLGNISSGAIKVNNVNLAAPWAPLNVFVP